VNPLLASLIRLVGFLLLLTAAHAGPEWHQLKVGMSRAETLKYLGQPLIRTKARGFERWIYDGSGEVFFTGGPVKFWTVPNPTPESDAKPVEEDVMFRPPPVPRFPATYQTAPPVTAQPTVTDGSRFRYR
jgi:hypothetical protein